MKASREEPLAYPRRDTAIMEWLRRNGVFFYQTTTHGQPWRSIAWCQCCGYVIPPMHSRHTWQSYHNAVGLVLLCGHCDGVAMQNVQETLKKLLAIIRESPDDHAEETDTETS